MQQTVEDGELEINFNGHTMKLHPYKAIYWPQKKALFLSDVHLGKLNHFRKHGIGIPAVGEVDNLRRLQELILIYDPADIYILGDLFHSSRNDSWHELKVFIETFQTVRFHLIAGNHDILRRPSYFQLGFSRVCDHFNLEGMYLIHNGDESKDDEWSLSGHIHPGVMLRGVGKQRLKMPCFWLRDKKMVLPAFGIFTGLYVVNIKRADRVFVVSEKTVFEVE